MSQPEFDRRWRLARALAAAFLSGAWTQRRLVARGEACLGARPPWLAIAARWTRHSFPTPPLADPDAVARRILALPSFLAATAGYLPVPTVRKAFLFTPLVPPGRFATPVLAHERDVADWLGLSVSHLQWLADTQGRNRRTPESRLHHYHPVWLRKPGGGLRLLEVPKPELKRAQRRILAGLLDHVPPHAAAHAFCRGRSVLSHASLHAGQAVVIRIDLADFFSSVSRPLVRAIFAAAGYPPSVAASLAGLCTTRTPQSVVAQLPGPETAADVPGLFRQRRLLQHPHLPQGAPTSPALANLCAYALDVRLTALAAVFGARYSRYADDLTLSGGAAVARVADRLVDWVTFVAHDCGFAVQHRKTRVMRAAVRQQVTGIVVNQRPNLRRAELDELRAILTNCVRHGPAGQNRSQRPDFRAWLQGRVSWVELVHPARGRKLRGLFERIVW